MCSSTAPTGAIGSAAVQLLKQVGATSRLAVRRATRVPYRRVNHGTERSATVNAIRLIDTRTWTVRQVDRRSSSAVLAAGRLLAFGTAFGTGPDGANRGYALTLYGPGDRQPVHRFGAKQVSWIQVNGELA